MFRAVGSGMFPLFRSVSGAFQDLEPTVHESWITVETFQTNKAIQHLKINAKRSNSIYVDNATVRPDCISVLVLIKL